jgi:hypothetical protein
VLIDSRDKCQLLRARLADKTATTISAMVKSLD